MADVTKIEWADSTFNPWLGCQKVGPGCDNCYAEALMDHRLHRVQWGPGQPRKRTSAANWRLPLQWEKEHEAFELEHGRRRRVFCASLADVFDNEVPPTWRAELFALIAATPNLDFLLLTKRIGNVPTMLEQPGMQKCGLPPNARLGITLVNQPEADRDLPKLLNLPYPNFVSLEPLLAPIDLTRIELHRGPIKLQPDAPDHWRGVREVAIVINALKPGLKTGRRGIEWVICGGESGQNARPMHPDWVRSLRDQCKGAEVPFLFKQWGEHSLAYDRDRDDPDWRKCDVWSRKPGRWVNLAGGSGFHGDRVHYAVKVGKAVAGRLLDGETHTEFPR